MAHKGPSALKKHAKSDSAPKAAELTSNDCEEQQELILKKKTLSFKID